jgi:hypothetical protein
MSDKVVLTNAATVAWPNGLLDRLDGSSSDLVDWMQKYLPFAQQYWEPQDDLKAMGVPERFTTVHEWFMSDAKKYANTMKAYCVYPPEADPTTDVAQKNAADSGATERIFSELRAKIADLTEWKASTSPNQTRQYLLKTAS